MSIGQPYYIYSDDANNQSNIFIYKYDDVTGLIESINIEKTSIELYVFEYAHVDVIDNGVYKTFNLVTGQEVNSQWCVAASRKTETIQTESFYNFDQLSENLSHYKFIDFYYKDVSALMANDLMNPFGIIPRYILFGEDTENLMINFPNHRLFHIPDAKLVGGVHAYSISYVVSMTELLKFNNSTVPIKTKPGRFLTAFRVFHDNTINYKQSTHIREDRGYIHIPPMWADYKMEQEGDPFYQRTDHCKRPYPKHHNIRKGAFYKGKNGVHRNNWNSSSYIMNIEHDYKDVFHFNIMLSTSNNYINNSLEDPRLYYVGNEIHMYTVSSKWRATNNGCRSTIEALPGNLENKADITGCVIVEEMTLHTDDRPEIFSETYNNTYDILCENSHVNINGNIGNRRLLEKNYMPFEDTTGNRFLFYQSTPFTLFRINPQERSQCVHMNWNQQNNSIDFLSRLSTALVAIRRLPVGGLLGIPVFHDYHVNIVKISQSGPAIHYSDDKTKYIAPMHIRISRSAYNLYRNGPGVVPNRYIDTNFRPFMNSIEKLYDLGEVILHDDIYLQFLIQFEFKYEGGNLLLFNLEKISNPFLFNYYNQKFMLQFNSSISKNDENGNIIFSFGEGDVLCRDVEMHIGTVMSCLLVHDCSHGVERILDTFKPVFIRPKNEYEALESLATCSKTLGDAINVLDEYPQHDNFTSFSSYIEYMETMIYRPEENDSDLESDDL